MRQILFSLPASLKTYQALGNFMYAQGIKQEMFQVVDEAINSWMAAFLKAKAQGAARTIDGYQWKGVFLPHGTTLRVVYKRKSFLAHVEGSELCFDGKASSPAQFVNEVCGTCRNAWKVLWLRFPNEGEWKQAFSLRKNQPKTRQKKFIQDQKSSNKLI